MSRREWLEQMSAATTGLLDDLRADDAPALRPLRADIEDLRSQVASQLDRERRDHPRLLVFLCGTTLMHAGAVGCTREERVDQAKQGTDPSLGDYATYVATEGALEKLQAWRTQGAEIAYLSVHRDASRVAASANALEAGGFPSGAVLSRTEGESYDDVIRRAAPDILIEDDCTSTGADDIAYAQLPPARRRGIMSVVVPEFGGLAHLPGTVDGLLGVPA